MQTEQSSISGHFKHKSTDYLANLQLFDPENIRSDDSTPSITYNTTIPNSMSQQSMSDDETYIRSKTKQLSYSNSHSSINIDDHDNDDKDEVDEITPLILRNIQSVNYPNKSNSRPRKKRSNSAMTFSSKSSRNHKLKKLQKKCKNQQSTLQIYQDKITHIQDDAEETEAAIKREYELRLLHFEAKYLQEKSEKSSLQSEVERLRQELYIIHEKERLRFTSDPSIGYSTGATKSPPEPNINAIHYIQRQNMQAYNTYDSSNTIVINSTNENTPNTVDTNTSTSSCTSSTSSDNTSTYSSTDSESDSTDYDSSDNEAQVINTQKRKGKYKQGKYAKGTNGKKKKKKIPKRLNKKNKKNGFWENVWSMFGPPNVMCSACSDNRR